VSCHDLSGGTSATASAVFDGFRSRVIMPHFDLEHLIQTVGYLGLFAIVFAETGLLVGFFLPGDSLLFTAGFLASQDLLNIWILIPVCFVAAVTGDAVGYGFGHRVGRRLFQRSESRFFKSEYLVRAEVFFLRYGGKAVVLARFLPIVRTFVPIIAGVGAMPYGRFAVFNVVGAVLWAIGVPLAGYFLGSAIPGVDTYLLPIIIVIIVVSALPSIIHVWRESGDEIKAAARRQFAQYRQRRSSTTD
jgi:membrane-associated protein